MLAGVAIVQFSVVRAFFAKLAELGVAIQHASVGTQLSGDDLLA